MHLSTPECRACRRMDVDSPIFVFGAREAQIEAQRLLPRVAAALSFVDSSMETWLRTIPCSAVTLVCGLTLLLRTVARPHVGHNRLRQPILEYTLAVWIAAKMLDGDVHVVHVAQVEQALLANDIHMTAASIRHQEVEMLRRMAWRTRVSVDTYDEMIHHITRMDPDGVVPWTDHLALWRVATRTSSGPLSPKIDDRRALDALRVLERGEVDRHVQNGHAERELQLLQQLHHRRLPVNVETAEAVVAHEQPWA